MDGHYRSEWMAQLTPINFQTLTQIVGIILLIAGGGMGLQRILSEMKLIRILMGNHSASDEATFKEVRAELSDHEARLRTLEATTERRKQS